ncbi:hypothetical protein [Rhodococcus sp. H29-C3]|uniref:hypothetical protein n=1 Tax=Rhodococcus sp. H29-C3 TaxID=3046307 RepID=UPI0024BB1325|nr:hypothetical protein [Rhodococcus sp. H29-C3]MDJ0362533.1 hypothetical protein [Rhodococcus sp. H29-C3]
MSSSVALRTVSDAAFAEAVEVLHDKVDVLLDRLTDSLLVVPPAGSSQWRTDFRGSRGTAGSVDHGAVRAELARRAGVADPASADRGDAAVAATSARPQRRTSRRRQHDPQQLSIFDMAS